MSINYGEPGNAYESYARCCLRDTVTFDFATADLEVEEDLNCTGKAFVLHPADIGPELRKLIFTNCPHAEFDHAAFNHEFACATRFDTDGTDPLKNTDRSTIVGCDAIVIPKRCVYWAGNDEDVCWRDYDCIRRHIHLAEIKLKIGGVVDAGAMGATAHRAWAMHVEGIVRKFMIVTDDDHVATMLKNPKSKGLADTSSGFYSVVVVPPPDSVVQLRNTIAAASFDVASVCAMVDMMCECSGQNFDITGEANKIIEYVEDYRHRQRVAAGECEASKRQRHDNSANAQRKRARAHPPR